MNTPVSWPTDPKSLHGLSVAFVDEYLPRLADRVRQRHIPPGETLALDGDSLWVISRGDLEVRVGNRVVETLFAKAVVGPWFVGASQLSLVSVGDGCDVVGYKNEELQAHLHKSPNAYHHWNALVCATAAHYFSLFAALKARTVPPEPKFRSFSPGEVILKEGEFGQEVLCLVDGSADVVACGTKVGKVRQEEIFGALAALTGAPRMASVVASTPAVCMVFERDDFEDLLRSHTALMSKLFEDLARAMHEANATIARLEKRQERDERGAWRLT